MMIPLTAALLYVLTWWNGVPAHCLVDTGSSYTLLRQSLASAIPGLGPAFAVAPIAGVNGSQFSARFSTVTNVGTADLGWENVQVAIVPDQTLAEDCILGMDVLGRQPIVVDYQHGRVYRAG